MLVDIQIVNTKRGMFRCNLNSVGSLADEDIKTIAQQIIDKGPIPGPAIYDTKTRELRTGREPIKTTADIAKEQTAAIKNYWVS